MGQRLSAEIIGTILLLAVYFLVGMLWYTPNMGGIGLGLPQNIIFWSVLFSVVAWVAMSHREILWQNHPAALYFLAGAIALTLPIFWSATPQWKYDAFWRLAGLWGAYYFSW